MLKITCEIPVSNCDLDYAVGGLSTAFRFYFKSVAQFRITSKLIRYLSASSDGMLAATSTITVGINKITQSRISEHSTAQGVRKVGGDDSGVTMKLRSDLMFAQCNFSSRERERERERERGALVVRHNWQGFPT